MTAETSAETSVTDAEPDTVSPEAVARDIEAWIYGVADPVGDLGADLAQPMSERTLAVMRRLGAI